MPGFALQFPVAHDHVVDRRGVLRALVTAAAP
jgi:hypothetical protein